MKNIKIKIILAFVLPLCCAYLLGEASVIKAKDVVFQSIKSSCQTNVRWMKKGKNQWISTTGISLKLYEEDDFAAVPSTYFWNSNNASEADSILKEADPGEEINVTEFFWRVANPWRIAELQSECPPDAFCKASPYSIHYLHRPENEWIIDRLMIRAQGVVTSKPDPLAPLSRDIYVALDGPYMPIFEGRFRRDGVTFWFSAQKTKIDQKFSTRQMRIKVLQQINDFLESSVKTNH